MYYKKKTASISKFFDIKTNLSFNSGSTNFFEAPLGYAPPNIDTEQNHFSPLAF